MPRPGRPKKIHDQAKREFCMLVGLGMRRVLAADHLGISLRAVQYEMRRTPAFRAQVRRAEMEAEAVPLANLRSGARSSWRAAAWYLERVFPDRYRRHKPGGLTVQQVDELAEEFIESILKHVSDPVYRREVLKACAEGHAVWVRRHCYEPNGIYQQQHEGEGTLPRHASRRAGLTDRTVTGIAENVRKQPLCDLCGKIPVGNDSLPSSAHGAQNSEAIFGPPRGCKPLPLPDKQRYPRPKMS